MTEKDNVKTSRSRALGEKVIYAALSALRDNNRELRQREVISEVQKRLQFDPWDIERLEKTGYVRWQSILHFVSIYTIKAGFLVKKSGIWYLTPEGEEALKLGEARFFATAHHAYKEWNLKHKAATKGLEDPITKDDPIDEEINVTQAEQLAMDGIKQYISSKNPYEFQDLSAALLRGMGYYTPFVAPKGKDGGVDIVAYRDPLGTVSPRIKIQIKHRESAATVQEVRQLMGILQKDGDVGIFISTGGFTPDARSTARASHVHVELIDEERFIGLWREFYTKLTDEDKIRLPLLPIYFLAPSE